MRGFFLDICSVLASKDSADSSLFVHGICKSWPGWTLQMGGHFPGINRILASVTAGCSLWRGCGLNENKWWGGVGGGRGETYLVYPPPPPPWYPGQLHNKIAVLRFRIQDPVYFWPLDLESGIGFFRIPDPKPIFLRAYWQFLGKKFNNSWKLPQTIFKII